MGMLASRANKLVITFFFIYLNDRDDVKEYASYRI